MTSCLLVKSIGIFGHPFNRFYELSSSQFPIIVHRASTMRFRHRLPADRCSINLSSQTRTSAFSFFPQHTDPLACLLFIVIVDRAQSARVSRAPDDRPQTNDPFAHHFHRRSRVSSPPSGDRIFTTPDHGHAASAIDRVAGRQMRMSLMCAWLLLAGARRCGSLDESMTRRRGRRLSGWLGHSVQHL